MTRALCASCCLLIACGAAPTPSEDTPPEASAGGVATSATQDAARWPREFVAGPGRGPALFLHQGSDAPALGYLSEGVPFKIAGLPENGRVPVRIRAGLKVRAWLTTRRLALRVQRRGKVRGTHAYVGPGDYVRFLSPAEEADWARVEVTPELSPGVFSVPAVGEFPLVGLSHEEPPADAEPPSPGQARATPAGVEVPLFARPGGDVVARLPALPSGVPVAVLRERGEWKGVRAGIGPYLVGYTNAALTDPPAILATIDRDSLQSAPGEVPLRLRAEADKPLWRLPAGTRVRFDGQTVAILSVDGWGREMNRYENSGEVDLFVAADDTVAVRGMVRITDLRPVETDAAAPAPTEATPTSAPAPAEASPTAAPTATAPAP